jgi:hypothetical protein
MVSKFDNELSGRQFNSLSLANINFPFLLNYVHFHLVSEFILFIRNLYFDVAHLYDGRFGHACP